jgi:hypothetical protein
VSQPSEYQTDNQSVSGEQRESSSRGPRPTPPSDALSFAAQYHAHSKPVFADVVTRDLSGGRDAVERARAYAERGKPDFVLAYLLAADLPDGQKRELYALAFERRADISERKADEMDRRFHRPFPLVRLEATKDRTTAARIRTGGSLRPGLGRPLPTL